MRMRAVLVVSVVMVMIASILVGVAGPASASAPTRAQSAGVVSQVANNPWPHAIVNGFATPSGNGYWLVYADGTVEPHGDAVSYGDASILPLAAPVVGGSATPSGNGYWLVAEDGGIFSYGDAVFHGSMGAFTLDQPVFSMTPTATGNGYWLVARDGGIFSFGDAAFHGSMGGITLNQPVTGITRSPSGNGYRMVARDGGIFSFGDAPFHGSLPGLGLVLDTAVGMAPTPSNGGYWIALGTGEVYRFGDATAEPQFNAPFCDPVAAMFANPVDPGYRLVLQSGRTIALGIAPGGNADTGTESNCLLDVADCQLPHLAATSEVRAGWPRSTHRLPATGTARVSVIFVDFSDAVAAETTADKYQAGFPGAEAILEGLSAGRLDVVFEPYHTWIRMPGLSSSYGLDRSITFTSHRDYMQQAIDLADPAVDFSAVDGVVVVAPSNAVAMTSSPAFVPNAPFWGLTADGNTIMSGFTRGGDWPGNDVEVTVHELGHTLGLVDAYDYLEGHPLLHKWVGIFDPMGDIAPPAGGNEMFAWHRWLLGWVDDAQMICASEVTVPIEISPVATSGGTEAIIVPITTTRAVVIESRKALGLDAGLAETGVLVYTVDSTVASGSGPIEVQGQHVGVNPDATVLVGQGESLTIEGVTITNIASAASGDTVVVVR